MNVSRGAMTWRCTLSRWQSRQVLAQVLTCLDRPCQTNLEEISFTVGLAPGWGRPWTVSNTLRLREAGTRGRTRPVEVSQSSVRLLLPIGMSSHLRQVTAVC